MRGATPNESATPSKLATCGLLLSAHPPTQPCPAPSPPHPYTHAHTGVLCVVQRVSRRGRKAGGLDTHSVATLVLLQHAPVVFCRLHLCLCGCVLVLPLCQAPDPAGSPVNNGRVKVKASDVVDRVDPMHVAVDQQPSTCPRRLGAALGCVTAGRCAGKWVCRVFSRVKRGRHSGHRAVTHKFEQQTLSLTAAAAAAA